MMRRPPRSTLFPYRRTSDLAIEALTVSAHDDVAEAVRVAALVSAAQNRARELQDTPANDMRSEEHTSELQSRRDLVCRLLLEKKKKNSQRLRFTSPILQLRN